MEKQRNKIVTYWLWLGIFISALFIMESVLVCCDILYMMADIDIESESLGRVPLYTEFGTYFDIVPYVFILQAIAAIVGTWMIVCYLLLLKWKKIGFWGLAIPPIVLTITEIAIIFGFMEDSTIKALFFSYPFEQFIILPTFSLVLWIVLFGILQIRKDNVSCWSQLE